MKQAATTLRVRTGGRGFTELTDQLVRFIDEAAISDGILTLLCRHTSASLLIQENAAASVQRDFADWFERIAPEGDRYAHHDEGPDDMPAHLRTALTGVNLSIPVASGRMRLGTWQGVFLAEHRAAPHSREVAVHLIGT